jgi:hypothetical protein
MVLHIGSLKNSLLIKYPGTKKISTKRTGGIIWKWEKRKMPAKITVFNRIKNQFLLKTAMLFNIIPSKRKTYLIFLQSAIFSS